MTLVQRGKISAAKMEIAAVTPLGVVDRQKPPHDLTDEEVEVWQSVVNAEPADWFSASTAPMLAQFCRHVVCARQIAELRERITKKMDLDAYDKLLTMQARESRAIAQLATNMRLSQQATINHNGNKKPSRKPLWE
jgi:hypothetical protein